MIIQHGRQQMQRSLGALSCVAAVYCLLLFSCDSEDERSSSTQAAVSSDPETSCDLTPIPETGTLRACAAGTSTTAGPGVPFNFTGTIQHSLPITPTKLTALTAAQALAEARNPPAQPPVDRGFPPARSHTQDQAKP